MQKQHHYTDCSYCGGQVKSQKVNVDFWYKEKLYLIENVPAGVCQQCGEQYFTAKIAKKMEASIKRNNWKRYLEVPVLRFPQLVSA